MFKKILVIGLVLVAIGAVVGYVMYNKPHRDIQTEEAAYNGYANDFFHEFESDSTLFKSKYEDKAIVIEGEVTMLESHSFELDGVVNCYLDSTVVIPEDMTRGQMVKVKGRYNGYISDDLFGTTLNIDLARFQ